MSELNRHVEDPLDSKRKMKRLAKIARKVCDLAEQGDMTAVREIGMRTDGAPILQVDHDGEQPLITEIRHVIVDPEERARRAELREARATDVDPVIAHVEAERLGKTEH